MTFISIHLIKPLLQKLSEIFGQRQKELIALADEFTDPLLLAVLRWNLLPTLIRL